MTVQTSTNVASFNGDGANKNFPIGYKFNSAADLVVLLLDDAEGTTQVLTLNSDYSVTGAGDDEGGAVTLEVAPTLNQRLKITRVVDIVQLTELRNQGKFYAETHEDAFDLLTMIAQQQQTEINNSLKENQPGQFDANGKRIVNVGGPELATDAATKEYVDAGDSSAKSYADSLLARLLRVSPSETVTQLPATLSRANRLLSFDASGNPVTVAPSDQSATELALQIAPDIARIATFPTTSEMSSQVVPATAGAFLTLGYRSPGDGGGALFVGPLSADPGTIDSVEVGYGDSATRRWFRITHKGAVNIDQLGAYGDSYDIYDGGTWRDETALFISAINLAASLGLYKITSSGGRGYGLQDGLVSNNVEIDLQGSTLYGNFGPWGISTVDGTTPIYWTRRMLYSEAANPVSVVLRNFKINGQNSPSVAMVGGEVMLDFRGGATAGNVRVALIDGEITRGANRLYTAGSGVTAPTAVLDYRNTDVLLYNLDLVILRNVEVRSSPAEMVTIQSDDGRTRWIVDDSRFTKRRDGSTNRWSSSALNIFNCAPGSVLRDSKFYEFVKGPANIETDGVLVENVTVQDVTDSNGLDFCESRAVRQNQIIVRNCTLKDISNVGIRASASNILCENNTFERVDICHSFEGGVDGSASRGAWVRVDAAPLYNVVVRNPVYKTFNASHANIIGVRVIGASASLPANVTVEGNGNHDRPTTRPLYGIHATHANLRLSGYHGEGRTAVVCLTGTCRLSADGVTFAPEAGQTVHTILMENATIGADAVCIRRSSRITELDAGYSDLRVLTSTVDLKGLDVEQSPGFPGVSNGVVQLDGELKGVSASFNVPAVAAGASTTTTVTVTGARIGDAARAAFSIDTAGLVLFARVSSDNTVTVAFFNPTGASIDIGGGIITAFVRQAR